jgi:DNA-directed RNA polymerase subunit beta'
MVKEYEQQYNDGLITQGEKYNKVVDAWGKCTDKVADEMMARIKSGRDRRGNRPSEADELDLHDEPLRCAWFAEPDEAVGRYAWPDGQAVG